MVSTLCHLCTKPAFGPAFPHSNLISVRTKVTVFGNFPGCLLPESWWLLTAGTVILLSLRDSRQVPVLMQPQINSWCLCFVIHQRLVAGACVLLFPDSRQVPMFCYSQKKPGRCLCFAFHQRLRVDACVLLFPRLTTDTHVFFIHQRNLACACVLLLSRLTAGTHVLLFTKGSKQVPVFHYSPHSQKVPEFCYLPKAQSRCLCFIISHARKKYLHLAVHQRLKAGPHVLLFTKDCVFAAPQGLAGEAAEEED